MKKLNRLQIFLIKFQCVVFFSARIINRDTGHNKFKSENISVSNEKNLTY